MLFSSWIFVAAFLPVVWLTFRFLQRRHMGEAALLWLIAASLFFYGWFKPVYVFILLVSIGFKSVEAAKGSVLLLLEPLFGILFAIAVFREWPSFLTMIGGVLVVVSIVYLYWDDIRASARRS